MLTPICLVIFGLACYVGGLFASRHNIPEGMSEIPVILVTGLIAITALAQLPLHDQYCPWIDLVMFVAGVALYRRGRGFGEWMRKKESKRTSSS